MVQLLRYVVEAVAGMNLEETEDMVGSSSTSEGELGIAIILIEHNTPTPSAGTRSATCPYLGRVCGEVAT